MKRRGSSGRWLDEHRRDEFVQRAQREGRIARSAYKLIAIDERDKLLRSGSLVVDLGAAPGGWSEYAAEKVGDSGTVVAVDILPMNAPPGVEVIEGDFHELSTLEALRDALGGAQADVVLSDMAPNFSGTKTVDQMRAMGLAELALDLCHEVLKPQGAFLVKVFHGEGFDDYVRAMRETFTKVVTRKPEASRARSRETYLLGRGLRN